MTCFDQENGIEAALHQALESSETYTFTLLGALGHHETSPFILLDRGHMQGNKPVIAWPFQPPQLALPTGD